MCNDVIHLERWGSSWVHNCVCACVSEHEGLCKMSAGEFKVHREFRAYVSLSCFPLRVLSILHTLDSRFFLVAEGPQLNVCDSRFSCRICRARGEETRRQWSEKTRRKQEWQCVLRDSWLLRFISLVFYFTDSRVYRPAVNFTIL